MTSIKKIVSTILRCENFAIFTHKNPDGDAIGSSLALSLALEKIGKRNTVFCSEKLPSGYSFIGHFHRFVKQMPYPSNFDCVIVIDCGDEKRIDKLYNKIENENHCMINIDHHISNNRYGDINYLDTFSSATAEQIYYITKKLGVILDKEMAALLYFAIITDTGNFKFSNTTYKTFKIAHFLARVGINISGIHRKTYEEKEIKWLKMLKISLNNLKSEENNCILWSSISCEEFEITPVNEVDTKEIIDMFRAIKETKIAVMFKEYKKGEIKVSFRSKEDIDVNQIAQEFSGGGHKSAAGCTIKGELNEVQELVIGKIKEYIRCGNIKC